MSYLQIRNNRVSKWANRNDGLLNLIGIVISTTIAAFGVIGPAILRRLASVSEYAESLSKYREVPITVGLVLFGITVMMRLRSLNRKVSALEQPELLLDEQRAANLSNWHYLTASWSLDDSQVLSVTDTAIGGFYRGGAAWENYDFEFDFHIINQYAGWIIRAHPFRSFVHVQVGMGKLRPHRFGIVGVDQHNQLILDFHEDIPEIDLKLQLEGWITARTELRGHRVTVYLNIRLTQRFEFLVKKRGEHLRMVYIEVAEISRPSGGSPHVEDLRKSSARQAPLATAVPLRDWQCGHGDGHSGFGGL